MSIVESIVSQHAEEAAFLWLLRDAAVSAPHYSLEDLAELDERVDAHIDGLRIAGNAGWPFCAEGLERQESGEVFTASVIALEGNDRQRIEQVYAVVERAPETARSLVSAIGWIPPEKLQGKIAGMLASESPLWRRVGIAACAIHRVDCGRYLTVGVEDTDARLRARALRAAGETARRDLLPALQHQVRSEEADCGFWAACSAVLLGDRRTCLSALQEIAVSESRYGQRAIQVLLRVLDPAEVGDLLKPLSQIPQRKRDLINACGVSGDPVYVPWLIGQTRDDPALARVAGESISFITGLDIAYEDLDGDWPEGFEAGPTERPKDEDVNLDPDEDLPWPNPELLQAWWSTNQSRFRGGTRYLAGTPISQASCRSILNTGMQLHRKAAALELALLRPEAVLFETRAPGYHQQALLASP